MFDPGISVGTILTEREVHERFECQTTFGIRMSRKNNLFVIMSGSAKGGGYRDEWDGDVLKYSGTNAGVGWDGRQALDGPGNNNGRLLDVWNRKSKGVPSSELPQIFLFTKEASNQCLYRGEVDICAKPGLVEDPDGGGAHYVFPLRLKALDGDANAELFDEEVDRYLADFNTGAKEAHEKAVAQSNANANSAPRSHESFQRVYERSSAIAAEARHRARGRCDLCGSKAPFIGKKGEPYLEVHHIKWLSDGGADTLDNVVALCPNCHRKMHNLRNPDDIARLRERVRGYANS